MKIFFICTGNICRSPLAESILKKELQDRGMDAEVASAGTFYQEGNPRDPFYVSLGAEKGFMLNGTSRFIGNAAVIKEMDEADYVFIFEEYHRVKVQRYLKYANWNRITLFREHCFGEKEDLDDPMGGNEELYRSVFNQIEQGCKWIADKLLNA